MSQIEVVKVPTSRPSSRPPKFGNNPKLYLELIENKEKVKQAVVNKEYIPKKISSIDVQPDPEVRAREDDSESVIGENAAKTSASSGIESNNTKSGSARSSENGDLDDERVQLDDHKGAGSVQYGYSDDPHALRSMDREHSNPYFAFNEPFSKNSDSEDEDRERDRDTLGMDGGDSQNLDSTVAVLAADGTDNQDVDENDEQVFGQKENPFIQKIKLNEGYEEQGRSVDRGSEGPGKTEVRTDSRDSADDASYDNIPSLSDIGVSSKKYFRDISETTLDESEELAQKYEYLRKFRILRQKYMYVFNEKKDLEIPEFTEHSDLKFMKTTYDNLVHDLSIMGDVETYKDYILKGSSGLEMVGSFLGYDISGFSNYQNSNMNKFHVLLYELGEKNYDPMGSSIPVELRILGLFVMNAVVFIGIKIMEKKMSSIFGNVKFPEQANQGSQSYTQSGGEKKMRGPPSVDDI